MERDPALYRPGVGIVLTNGRGGVWLGRRYGRDGWQLPQGGIDPGESAEDAVWRELEEEVGTRHAELLGGTAGETFYEFRPGSFHADAWTGQRHRWFVLRFLGDDRDLDPASVPDPEFDTWRWATPQEAIDAVVSFKKPVYREALGELRELIG